MLRKLEMLTILCYNKKNFDLKELLTGKRECVLAIEGAGVAFPDERRENIGIVRSFSLSEKGRFLLNT